MLIDLIAGARPNFMKIAPITHAIQLAQKENIKIDFRLIHTGQHYDKNMSDSFFEQLNIPYPDVNLGAGGGTQAEQTAAIMIGYEKVINEKKPDLCLVVGDVTSTMACSITAQKLNVKVAHVEAGIRSGDWTMPEEINRMVTDSITNYFFTTTEIANDNLKKNGVSDDRIGGFEFRYGRESYTGGTNNGTSLYFNITNSSSTTTGIITNAPVSQWHFYSGTYDNTTLKTYLDGALFTSSAHSSGGQLKTKTGSTIIGVSPGTAEYLDGNLSIVMIYNRPLTSTEIISKTSVILLY